LNSEHKTEKLMVEYLNQLSETGSLSATLLKEKWR